MAVLFENTIDYLICYFAGFAADLGFELQQLLAGLKVHRGYDLFVAGRQRPQSPVR